MTTETQPVTDPTVKVTRDLTEIITLSEGLLTQAVHDSRAQVDGTSLPGGRAMVALAAVGDIETFERRVELAERAWFAELEAAGRVTLVDGTSVRLDGTGRPDPAADEDEDDTAPALQIIRYWSERYRWELGAVWDHIPTLATEAKFLRNPDVLAHVAAHHADEWIPLAQDINRARRHLESILHAGRRPDMSRVLCDSPTCETPKRLIRVNAPRYTVAWKCTSCATTIPETRVCADCHRTSPASADRNCRRLVGRKDTRRTCDGTLTSATTDLDHCPNPWCHTTAPPLPVEVSNASDDRWKCTACKKRYDDQEYLDAYATMLKAKTAERFVTVREAISTLAQFGRPEVTVRSWLQPPRRHVADRCILCKRTWPPTEHNVCPGNVKGTLESCGGELRPVRRGNADRVILAYCDLATHQTYVWWPDVWGRHNDLNARAAAAAAKKATATRGTPETA
jgi:hypothetical protein